MKINDINQAIMNSNFTNDELDSIQMAVKFRRGVIAKEVRRELQPGVTVSFVSNRNGRKYVGTVDSVKIKNAIVSTSLGRYRVPCNMLVVEA
jgi:hypothetical protein